MLKQKELADLPAREVLARMNKQLDDLGMPKYVTAVLDTPRPLPRGRPESANQGHCCLCYRRRSMKTASEIKARRDLEREMEDLGTKSIDLDAGA